MGLDFVSGQYGYLFSRCRKYVINSLIYGHFHIGLVIIPRLILALDSVSGQYGVLGMITRSIWKYPCINLYVGNIMVTVWFYIVSYPTEISIHHSFYKYFTIESFTCCHYICFRGPCICVAICLFHAIYMLIKITIY